MRPGGAGRTASRSRGAEPARAFKGADRSPSVDAGWYDIDASFDNAIEHEMRAGRILAVACADVIATAATTGILGHDLYGALNLADIDLGLLDTPNAGAVIPNLVNVALGRADLEHDVS